jgi:hypothetical protein
LFIEKILKADASETSYFHSINKKFEWRMRNHKEDERAGGKEKGKSFQGKFLRCTNVSSRKKSLKSIEKLLEHENHLFFSFFAIEKAFELKKIVQTGKCFCEHWISTLFL